MFKDELPLGLNFALSQMDVHKMFGKPWMSGGGEESLLYGVTPFWDKYNLGKFYLHLQFTKDLFGIELITIFSLDMNHEV